MGDGGVGGSLGRMGRLGGRGGCAFEDGGMRAGHEGAGWDGGGGEGRMERVACQSREGKRKDRGIFGGRAGQRE